MIKMPTTEEIDELVHKSLQELSEEIIKEIEIATTCDTHKIARKEVIEIIERVAESKERYFYEVEDGRD